MPNSVTQTKFILKRGGESKYSTEEFRAKFTYQIIGTVRKTEPIRKMLRKETKCNLGAEQEHAFTQLKKDIANIAELINYDPEAQTVLTTDASTKGLLEPSGKLMREVEGLPVEGLPVEGLPVEGLPDSVTFASRYLCRTEKNKAINGLELLAGKTTKNCC